MQKLHSEWFAVEDEQDLIQSEHGQADHDDGVVCDDDGYGGCYGWLGRSVDPGRMKLRAAMSVHTYDSTFQEYKT